MRGVKFEKLRINEKELASAGLPGPSQACTLGPSIFDVCWPRTNTLDCLPDQEAPFNEGIPT